MRNFITNSKTNTLKERLSELVEKSDELKFLVGFFYFSGLKEFYESLVKNSCLLYTSDAADDLLCVDLGGRRIIKKKK